MGLQKRWLEVRRWYHLFGVWENENYSPFVEKAGSFLRAKIYRINREFFTSWKFVKKCSFTVGHRLTLINARVIFSVLGEWPTHGINESSGIPEKKIIINFGKASAKFCLSFRYNGHSSYLFVERKEIYKFKVNNKNANFPT